MESGVQPQPIGLSPEDRDALQALTDRLVSLSLDRGWDALLELLTDDVVFLPPDEPAVIGKAEVADFLNAYPIMTQFRSSIDSADGRADLAAVRSSWESTLELEEGETWMAGKGLATYRKEGGRWRVATNCWNLDAPMMGTNWWKLDAPMGG